MVHGLTRARGFTQDDAHIYCTREQMGEEVLTLLQFVLDLLRDYGLDDFYLELSTRNPGQVDRLDQAWEEATGCCGRRRRRSVWTSSTTRVRRSMHPRSRCRPKDAIRRTWQMSTIQVDLMLPDRSNSTTRACDGIQAPPGDDPPGAVRVHRAVSSVLTEHYAGAFPGCRRSRSSASRSPTPSPPPRRCHRAAPARRRARAEVDFSDDRMQKKIRTHTTGKVPFMLLAGERDVEANGAVSFGSRTAPRSTAYPSTWPSRDHRGRLAPQRITDRAVRTTLPQQPRRRPRTRSPGEIRDVGTGDDRPVAAAVDPTGLTYIAEPRSSRRQVVRVIPFLDIPTDVPDGRDLILARRMGVRVNLYPYSPGTMVVPYRRLPTSKT